MREEYDEEDEYSEEDDTGWEEGSIYKGETEDNPEDIDEAAEPVAGFDKQGSLSNTKEVAAGKSEPNTQQTEERIKSYWYQLQREQKGQVRGWYQLLVIFVFNTLNRQTTHHDTNDLKNWNRSLKI